MNWILNLGIIIVFVIFIIKLWENFGDSITQFIKKIKGSDENRNKTEGNQDKEGKQ